MAPRGTPGPEPARPRPAAPRRLALSSGEASGWFLARASVKGQLWDMGYGLRSEPPGLQPQKPVSACLVFQHCQYNG
jgi:hypothetical protein